MLSLFSAAGRHSSKLRTQELLAALGPECPYIPDSELRPSQDCSAADHAGVGRARITIFGQVFGTQLHPRLLTFKMFLGNAPKADALHMMLCFKHCVVCVRYPFINVRHSRKQCNERQIEGDSGA